MNGEFSPRVLPLCIVMMITSFSPSTCHPSSGPPPPAPGVSGSRPGRSRSRLPGCRPRSHSQTASFKCREIQRGYNEDTTGIQREYNEDTMRILLLPVSRVLTVLHHVVLRHGRVRAGGGRHRLAQSLLLLDVVRLQVEF